MLKMLRVATTKFIPAANTNTARHASPYQNYMCYRDGRQFMVINAPSLEHAQFIIAGFSTDHSWMLVAMQA